MSVSDGKTHFSDTIQLRPLNHPHPRPPRGEGRVGEMFLKKFMQLLGRRLKILFPVLALLVFYHQILRGMD